MSEKGQKTLCIKSSFILLALVIQFFQLQASSSNPEIESEYLLDEITIIMDVKGLGKYYVDALYTMDSMYLSIPDVFQELRIKQEVSFYYDSISGFFISEDYPYLINYPAKVISLGKKEFALGDDQLIKTETGLYMNLDLYGKIFGLYCTFDERNMLVVMETDIELPALKEMRIKKMRQNVSKITGDYVPDTTLQRNYHNFNHGMLDWFLQGTYSNQNDESFNARIAYGSEVLNGETKVSLNYNSDVDFLLENQEMYWRWVDNDQTLLRQAKVGTITRRSISTIQEQIIGVELTNAPSKYRKTFGSYVFSDFIEPNWTVELYVNNVLVDYTSTDANGFYSFNIPMSYGYSDVKLQFFGPYGEEQVQEQRINIPFTFLPQGEFEYASRNGIVMDSAFSRFSRSEINYGLTKTLTTGVGMEYLSSLENNQLFPFVYASSTIAKSLLLNIDYAMDIRAKVELSYRNKKNLALKLSAAKFNPNQTAVRFQSSDEINLNLNSPYKIFSNRGNIGISYGLEGFEENLRRNKSNIIFSSRFGRLNLNLNNVLKWSNDIPLNIFSTFAANYRIDRRYILRSTLSMNVLEKKPQMLTTSLERRINKDFSFTLSYQNFLPEKEHSISFSLKYYFPFSQTTSTVRYSKKETSSSFIASGSVAYDRKNKYIYANTGKSVGRGGITIAPFLDINHNGVRDEGEKLSKGLGVISQGGDFIDDSKDTLIRISGLELYTPHLLEFEEAEFNNVSWQLKDKMIRVYPDPNQFKQIDVPIVAMGEAYGMVFLRENDEDRGQGRIIIKIYNDKDSLIHETLSESDGYFSYYGLTPGNYYAALDHRQLDKIDMEAIQDTIPFEIKAVEDGDYVGDLNYILREPAENEDIEELNVRTPLIDSSIENILEGPIDSWITEDGDRIIISDSCVILGRVLSDDGNVPLQSFIEIIDPITKETKHWAISDSSSGYYRMKVYREEQYYFELLAEDHMYFSDTVYLNHPLQDVFTVDFTLKKLQLERKFTLENIFFEIDSAELRPESYLTLNALLGVMLSNPNLKIEIRGHTSNTGTHYHNMQLSGRRAQAVVDYLVSSGISAERLKSTAFGPNLPIATNKTKKGRQLNRRVEFKVIDK